MIMVDRNKVKKGMLFYKTRQYNIHIFDKIIFFKNRTRQVKTTETNKKVTLLILIETLDTENLYFVLSY